jgi:hypothetical protein
MQGGPKTVKAHETVASKDGSFWLVVSHSAENSLQGERDFAPQYGTWLRRGDALGLARYQQISGVRNGKPITETSYLGAKYIGDSPGENSSQSTVLTLIRRKIRL